jgi:hypothetical protein
MSDPPCHSIPLPSQVIIPWEICTVHAHPPHCDSDVLYFLINLKICSFSSPSPSLFFFLPSFTYLSFLTYFINCLFLFFSLSLFLHSFLYSICWLYLFYLFLYTRGNKIGRLVYANGRPGGTVVTVTLLFTFIMILLTVRLPTQLE